MDAAGNPRVRALWLFLYMFMDVPLGCSSFPGGPGARGFQAQVLTPPCHLSLGHSRQRGWHHDASSLQHSRPSQEWVSLLSRCLVGPKVSVLLGLGRSQAINMEDLLWS